MVAPIVGPIYSETTVKVQRVGSMRKAVWRYKQAKPYNKALAYQVAARHMLSVTGPGPGLGLTWLDVNNGRSPVNYIPAYRTLSDSYVTNVINTARARFVSKLGHDAQLLATLAESKKTMNLVFERITQFTSFFKSVRRFEFRGCAEALGLVDRKRIKRALRDPGYQKRWAAKSFADRSLEFAFGWAPLYDDLSSALEMLSEPIPLGKVKGRARWEGVTYSTVIKTSNWPYYSSRSIHRVCKIRAEMGAMVEVVNPNLYLASRTGLTNLAGTAWEIIPWSFVVDYWFNVSQFLGQWTEFGGIRFSEPYHTIRSVETCSHSYFDWAIDDPSWGTSDGSCFEDAIYHERKLGIPSVTLQSKFPWRLSAFRAWTSVSLLLQQGFKSYR